MRTDSDVKKAVLEVLSQISFGRGYKGNTPSGRAVESLWEKYEEKLEAAFWSDFRFAIREMRDKNEVAILLDEQEGIPQEDCLASRVNFPKRRLPRRGRRHGFSRNQRCLG